jgi:glycine/D-amino acid oxidase-like deaminating enzyme
MKPPNPDRGLSRRRLLAAAGVSALPAASSPLALGGQEPSRRFPRVQVAADRVIRQVAGLRPYRPRGFVVRTEQLGAKLLVHNYGHGGGGVTLSWGTSRLAVDEVVASGARDCAVIGCGAVGLATARLLQDRGVRAVVYARAVPPDTTSNAAGAMWFPVSVYDDRDAGATTAAFREQFENACRWGNRHFQDMVGGQYGVRWIQTYFLFPQRPNAVPFPGGRGLYPEHRIEAGGVLTAPYAESFHTMLIETPAYLDAVRRDFYLAGGRIVVRDFRNRNEVAQLAEAAVVNCTGLGARELFGDRELRPLKGQLVILLPQPEIDYAYVSFSPGNLLYMFPRRDGIILGGTEVDGDESVEPDPAQTERILNGHAAIQRAVR